MTEELPKQEPKIEKEYLGEDVIAQIRDNIQEIERLLRGAVKGTEPIQEGGVEKLNKALVTLKEARSFLEVL